MKKAILILSLAVGSMTTFAQGKVSLAMDLPITMGPYALFLSDFALANQPLPTSGPLPSGVSIAVGLYAGTTSANLSLVGSVVVNPVGGGTGMPDGYFPIAHIILPFPGGQLAYFQVKIWDAVYPSLEAQWNAGHGFDDYSNWNNIFTMTPGTTISYPQIYNGGNTTWSAVGNEDVNALLVMGQIPEPAALALAALATVSFLVRCRKKNSRDA